MATVHRAEKRGVGIRKPIALKRLLPHVAADPDLIKLFVDEARLASHLHHANVAQTYELGKVDDTFFIAMEYASGPTLSQILRQCQKAAGEIPLTVTVNILAQVCEALDYAHNLCDDSGQPLRIIHRDVSPANIIVANTGIVKLIDFGIAKATISSVKTQTGFIKGKFGYIAPEYITGKIDARVDLFAVGVVAHEMLAGRRLFEGKDDFETLANIREMVMQPPSRWNAHVTPDLDDIVMTALERDPAKRWQSAAAMQVALSNVAREFGLVVGGQQLAEWIDWAFSQVPSASGSLLKTGNAADTDAIGRNASALGRRDSSVIIELSHAPADLVDTVTPHEVRRALSPSESDETVPLERVQIAFNDLEVLTPPVGGAVVTPPPLPAPPSMPAPPPMPPPRARAHDSVPPSMPAPPPMPPPRTRAHDSVPPPIPPPRTSLPPDAGAPPPTVPPPPPPPPPKRSRPPEDVGPPPVPSRTAESVVPAIPPSREIEVIVVPPGGMFDEPAPEPTEPAKPAPKAKAKAKAKAKPEAEAKAKPEPKPKTKPEPKPKTKPEPKPKTKPEPKAKANPEPEPKPKTTSASPPPKATEDPVPDAQPGKRHTVLWLILLMIALGTGAMAAAYYWPDLY